MMPRLPDVAGHWADRVTTTSGSLYPAPLGALLYRLAASPGRPVSSRPSATRAGFLRIHKTDDNLPCRLREASEFLVAEPCQFIAFRL